VRLSVCVFLSVRPRTYLWTNWHTILCADFLWLWVGPPPAALHYVMYFRFMDDVTFGRNGRDTKRWRLTRAATAMNGVAIPGRSLMFMNACFQLLTVCQPVMHSKSSHHKKHKKEKKKHKQKSRHSDEGSRHHHKKRKRKHSEAADASATGDIIYIDDGAHSVKQLRLDGDNSLQVT